MVTVTVPATTANLGPGFDCIGAALALYNRFELSLAPPHSPPLHIQVTGAEADRVITDERNLAYQAFVRLYAAIDTPPPPVQITIALDVPLARGLGSSATAIVGGLLAANALAGSPLTQAAVMTLAIEMEGHPDNVVPALLGGCRLSASGVDSGWVICDLPWHPTIVPVVAIPDFELSTAEARRVLPQHYSRADAIFNAAHVGLLLRGLTTGQADWLRAALQDRIHQPYRQTLIPGYEAVERAALDAGAHGLVISGAGPTLLALTDADRAEAVKQAMVAAWQAVDVQAAARVLKLDTIGAVVQR